MEQDLTFEFENKFFNYRVGAIIIRKNKILLATNPNVTFYYSVGGRVHFGETSEEALHREVFEEIGIRLEIDRLGFINECFFRIGPNRIKAHEIAMYYYMKDSETLDNIKMNFKDGSYNNFLKWLDIEDLGKNHIYPEFLQEELQNPKYEIIKIISKD